MTVIVEAERQSRRRNRRGQAPVFGHQMHVKPNDLRRTCYRMTGLGRQLISRGNRPHRQRARALADDIRLHERGIRTGRHPAVLPVQLAGHHGRRLKWLGKEETGNRVSDERIRAADNLNGVGNPVAVSVRTAGRSPVHPPLDLVRDAVAVGIPRRVARQVEVRRSHPIRIPPADVTAVRREASHMGPAFRIAVSRGGFHSQEIDGLRLRRDPQLDRAVRCADLHSRNGRRAVQRGTVRTSPRPSDGFIARVRHPERAHPRQCRPRQRIAPPVRRHHDTRRQSRCRAGRRRIAVRDDSPAARQLNARRRPRGNTSEDIDGKRLCDTWNQEQRISRFCAYFTRPAAARINPRTVYEHGIGHRTVSGGHAVDAVCDRLVANERTGQKIIQRPGTKRNKRKRNRSRIIRHIHPEHADGIIGHDGRRCPQRAKRSYDLPIHQSHDLPLPHNT